MKTLPGVVAAIVAGAFGAGAAAMEDRHGPAASAAPAASAPARRASVAATPVEPQPVTRYALGIAVSYAPEYSGAQRSVFKPRPLWAWQRGRFRVSTSGANTVLGFGSTTPDTGAGASADIAFHDRWRFGAGLRIDNGRRSSDSAELAGIPDVRRTVRLRLYSSYTLDSHWSAIATVSDDLLRRGGGASGSLDVGYGHAIGANAVWSVSAGLRVADRRYLRARYGIPPEVAAATGRDAYDPRAGLESLNLGAGLTRSLSPNWIVFGGVSAASLRGGAAVSPLTTARSTWQVSVGVGWRNKP